MKLTRFDFLRFLQFTATVKQKTAIYSNQHTKKINLRGCTCLTINILQNKSLFRNRRNLNLRSEPLPPPKVRSPDVLQNSPPPKNSKLNTIQARGKLLENSEREQRRSNEEAIGQNNWGVRDGTEVLDVVDRGPAFGGEFGGERWAAEGEEEREEVPGLAEFSGGG